MKNRQIYAGINIFTTPLPQKNLPALAHVPHRDSRQGSRLDCRVVGAFCRACQCTRA